MKKRILSILIIASIILGVCPTAYAAAPTLPSTFTSLDAKVGSSSPFKPIHMYASMQNPPDFTWPQITDAYSYDVVVASDEALTNVCYSANDIKYSYCNFRYAFEPGTYWWAVRYRTKSGGEASEWSVARRFRIDPSAHEYIVPDFGEVAASIPETHPRIWFTEDTIDEFIAQKNSPAGYNIYQNIVNTTQVHMTQEFEEDTNLITSVVTSRATKLGYRAQNAALAYILTDDPEEKKTYGDYAVSALLHAASWGYELNERDGDGNMVYVNGSARNGNDQAFFELLLRTSMAFDWMYNYMIEEGREDDLKTIQNMLVGRFDTIKDYQLNLLRKEPYNSHFWSYFGYYGMTCLALIHDIEGVDDYFAQMLELNSAQLPPMSVEDGGWSKGTAYWTYAFTRDKWFMDAMKYAGYIDYYDKTWARNELKWALYMFPDNSWGSFGDESGTAMAGTSHVMGLTKLGKFTDNPVAYWLRNKIGTLGAAGSSTFDSIMYADTAEELGEAPYEYPKAHLFVDQGMVGMHSSVISSDRTSLYFRSGKYGSYNHMHADQNAFFIEHNGNKLATKSGFYDSYHSVHDSNFTRQTFAHNSVTYSGGKGQLDDSMDANGNVKQFVTHHDFDAVVGDATNAYNGNIGSFIRSIIYIRPDSYIVIDNLNSGNYTRRYEWWLNAPHGTLTVDGKTAKVSNNGSQLDVNMIHPNNIADGVFMQNYVNPADGIEYYPDTTTGKVSEEKAEKAPDRVYFQTPLSTETTIISTMSVSEGEPVTFTETEHNGYIKLTADGDDENTVIYIRTAASGSVTTEDGYSFDATALVISDNTFMMVNGYSLSRGSSVIEKTTEPVTLVIGKGQLSLAADDDVQVKIYKNTFIKDYLPETLDIANMKDINGRAMEAYVKDTHSPTGIMMSSRTTYFTLYADKGHYMYLTEPGAFVSSDQMIPFDVAVSSAGDGNAQITWKNNLDGVTCEAEINGVIHKNITSPYVFDTADAEYVTVKLRGKAYNLESAWTDIIAYYPNANVNTSHIELTVDSEEETGALKAGDSVSASVHLNDAGAYNVSLILAQYNSAGEFVNMIRSETKTPRNSQHLIAVGPAVAESDGNYFKAYTLTTEKISPVGKSAITQGLPYLEGISADGVEIQNFDKEIFTYTVTTPSDGTLPVIKGISSNNGLYVTTEYTIASNSKSAAAVITAEAYDGTKNEYTVNITLASGAEKIIPFIKNFTQICGGMTYEQYCDYVESIYGINPSDGSVTASMSKKAPSNYSIRQFAVGNPLTGGNNTQRRFTSLDRKFGWENLYFIGSDPAMSQAPGNVAAWVQAAFYGTPDTEEILDEDGNGTGENLMYNFKDYFVPWYEFEVTRDCEVIILSYSKLPYHEGDKTWRYSYLETSPYTVLRTDTVGNTSAVSSFRNMYVKEFKAGEKVSLYNENNGVRPVTGYITLVNPK